MTAPGHDASRFSHLESAPARIPLWYWNRYVLLRLRDAIARILDELNVGDGSSVIEYGCGNRPYARMVQVRGARYTGADLPGNTHADLIIDSAGRVPEANGSFDVVISAQVLEHVADPAAYLREARRLLAPGHGRLLLSTHGMWVYHPSPNDFWRWTAPGLRKLVEEQGFEVVAFQGVIGPIPATVQLLQDFLRPRLPRWLRRPLSLVMQQLVGVLDRLHSDAARAREAMVYVVLAAPRLESVE